MDDVLIPNIYAAPLQGYTEAVWRHFHTVVYGGADGNGGIDGWFSPFVRIEKGAPRGRDMRDVTSPLNANHTLVPQIIFRDADEFRHLVAALSAEGFDRIDLNMGCPFPPQVKSGRGAALLRRPDVLEEVERLMAGMPQIGFSVKMRLGVERPDEWRGIAGVLGRMPLRHVAVHARVAAQGYDGPLHMDEFSDLLAAVSHPVMFNGDVRSAADVRTLAKSFPQLKGIMIGRGLLGRPWLAAEIREGADWEHVRGVESLLRLHEGVYGHYARTLCGTSQVLMKMKPFWDYLEPVIGRKAAKALRKATTLPKYEAAVRMAASSTGADSSGKRI